MAKTRKTRKNNVVVAVAAVSGIAILLGAASYWTIKNNKVGSTAVSTLIAQGYTVVG